MVTTVLAVARALESGNKAKDRDHTLRNRYVGCGPMLAMELTASKKTHSA